MVVKAIETTYNGYRFRSRIEARWGIYLDTLKVEWVYEHEGYKLPSGWYLPDFWLPGLNCFAEVKASTFSEIEFQKCHELPKPCILLDTSIPKIANGYFITGVHPFTSTYQKYLENDEYGRVLFSMSAARNRLWFLMGESAQDYILDFTPETKAQQARFEYGEVNHAIQIGI